MGRFTKYLSQPVVAALLASCAVILLFLGLGYLERERYRETLQTKTINSLSGIRASLESEINTNFYLTRGLIAYIATNPDMDGLAFHRLAREILRNHSYIRNITVAPDNIVRFIHPLKGNEQAIGLDYRQNSEQWPAAARAIESGRTVIAGPVNLVQGGVAFINRTPVYVEGEEEDDSRYWGLVSIVIEKDRLFKAAGLHRPELNIEIAIRGKDGLGSAGGMIDGDPSIFEKSPITLPVKLPEGSWQLAAVPKAGWSTPSPYLVPLRVTAIFAVLAVGLGTFYWLRREENIRRSLVNAWLEAQKAQERLRLNEEFLATVFDNIPAMIFVKDARDLRFVHFNRTGAAMLGYQVDDFLGKTDFDFFPEVEAKFFTAKDREVLRLGTLVDIPEEPIQTRNRGKRVLHTRKIPILDAEGQPRYLLGISEDITDQIRVSAEKEDLERRLQQAEKLETIGKLAGGVAHDLNNILSGIINYPELLLLQLPPESPIRKPLADIRESGKRAARVVADLLTLARGVAAVRENISIKDLAKEYLESPEHIKLAKLFPKISFASRLAPDIRTVSCSSVHIQKCLMNLVINGAEAFPPESPGTIVISCRNEDLASPLPGFSDLTPGPYVVLSVADDGPGIDQKDLAHIFEPFYTRKTMGRSGTGLGLAVVWNTMKDHEGAVTVESASGTGTTFSLYLPATAAAVTTQPPATAMEELYGRGERILVVDDEALQRDIAVQILKNLHYSAATASSGEAAIEYLEDHAVDLVILDMIMKPGLSGRETYERIVAAHPGQKAIIASGFADHDEVAKIQTLGAGQYVKKPYTLEQLGVAVRVALGDKFSDASAPPAIDIACRPAAPSGK